MDLKTCKKDFEEFNDVALGILLYGSCARGNSGKMSDIDICIVKPDDYEVMRGIHKRLGGKYDVKVFEKMPLYIQIEIIRNHRIIHEGAARIGAYFYRFRRLWEDMATRIYDDRFDSVDKRTALRRRWINENGAILGDVGSL